MRLTLRTLLAWLDDTLPPIQVREIGRQVSESAYAQELVERIHRVTRQRRLTVPGRSGPEGADPNIVAGYVDNDLDPEQVGEYEKKCLGSDVNLAEASSVHQVLSLLGQKVHVPVEAKARMYQLIKGRESTPVARGDGVKPAVRAPVTEPIQPWVAPAPPARHWLGGSGPVAGCLVLVALLSWSAYQSLAPPPPLTPSPGVLQQPAAGAAPGAAGSAEPVATNLPAGNSRPAAAGAIAGTAAAGDSKAATVAEEAELEAITGSVAASPKTADNSGKPKNEPGDSAGPCRSGRLGRRR